jgi:hypothetical protein
MKLPIRISAAVATFDAVKKLDTSRELAPDLSQQSSGRFGGSIIVHLVVNMDGAVLKRMVT